MLKEFRRFLQKVDCPSNFDDTPNGAKQRQTAAPVLPTPSKYYKTRVIVNGTPKLLEKFDVFKAVLPDNGSFKNLLKLNTFV